MKTPLAVVMMLSIAAAAQQQSNQTQYPTSVYLGSAPSKMSISDVINLTRAGVSDEVIIQQLSRNGRRFALSSAQIVQLKKAGVSDRVVEAMIDPTKATTQQKQAAQPSDPPSSARASAPPHEQPNIAARPIQRNLQPRPRNHQPNPLRTSQPRATLSRTRCLRSPGRMYWLPSNTSKS